MKKEPKEQPVISHKSMIKMQARLNLSNNKGAILAEELREATGMRIVEPKYEEKMSERSKKVRPYHDTDIIDGKVVGYVKDIPGLLRHEKISEIEMDLQCGIDDGQKVLKVCCSGLCSIEDVIEEEEIVIKQPNGSNKRKKKFKASGQRRNFVIFAAPELQESHENLKEIFKLLKLNELEKEFNVTYSGDLKIINLLLGLGSCSSTFNCYICHVRHHTIGVTNADKRSLETIKYWSEKWKDESGIAKELCDFFNCR